MIRSHLLAFVAAASVCAGALAQAVEFRVEQHEGWVDTPIIMQVIAANTGDDPQPPEIAPSPDFSSSIVDQPQRMDMRRSINGVTSRRITTTWTVQMTPKRAGVLSLPQVKMVVDGRTYLSQPQTIPVSASESGDVLSVSVKSNPSTLYAGQTANLILEIAIRPYANRDHDLTLTERQMWELIDKSSSSWGIFEPRIRELVQNNQRPSGREELRDDARWCVYDIDFVTNAAHAGALNVGDVRIDLRYPTGIVVNHDFFGQPELAISGIRKISSSPPASNVAVKALPEAGKPASFRGAVGKFSIQASVKPAKAAVGDPMTLTLAIRSLSDNAEELRTLQPPPLETPALTQRFRMPTDPLAGTVDGSTKIFTQTLRPLSADVKEIPPIEFSYFDPATAKYATASSSPIPIQISPTERISTTAMEGLNPSKKDPAKTNLTEVNGGLFANAAPGADLLKDQRLSVGWQTGVAFAAPLALALAALLVRKRNQLSRNNRGLARSRSAARNARRQLENAGEVAAVAQTILAYIEARTGRPPGTVTRGEATTLAREAGADDSRLQLLDSILASGERAAFAPQRGADAKELREQAARLVTSLDQLAWRRKNISILEELPQ